MGSALEIPMAPIAGGWIGYYLDAYFKTQPFFMALLGLLGVLYGIVTIIRLAREMSPRS